jgi:hypothetical protein
MVGSTWWVYIYIYVFIVKLHIGCMFENGVGVKIKTKSQKLSPSES